MARKLLYVDSNLLKEIIKDSGIKIGFICECLGLSRQGFWKKMNGLTPFRVVEVNFLCDLLHISTDNRTKIFKPKVEEIVD